MKTDYLKELHKEYDAINAETKLRERIEMTMKKEKRRMQMFRYGAGAVACLAALTISLNVSSNFAYAMSNIPVINSIVKVLTLNKYEAKENNYEARVVTPKIEGLLDKELEEKINKEFEKNAKSVVAAFEANIKELNAEFGEGNFHEGIVYDYEVKTDTDDILALDVYLYGASGSSWIQHTYYNIDKHTGELLNLKGLFKDGSDYVTPISAYIGKEIVRLNKEEDGLFFLKEDGFPEDVFDKILEDHKFYLNEEGSLVICFDKYEISAGAQGSPEFAIPNEIIKDILK